MSSADSPDRPGDCTLASKGGIAVFPPTATDLVSGAAQSDTLRGGPLVPLALAFAAGIVLAPALGPKVPKPPALETAATSLAPLTQFIGAWIMG